VLVLSSTQQFNAWLNDQSTSETPTEAYTQNCNGASAVPVPSDVFDPCMIAWSKLTNSRSVLSKQGSVKIMDIRAKSKVVYDSPFDELEAEWELYEAWMENERSVAPKGVNKMFNSDFAYWWYDTNLKMLRTAYGAAAIALSCAAVVVFVSSRSFVLTFFAAISIAYVLVATTACLVRWCTVVVQSLCCLVTCDTSFSSSIAFLYCIILAGCTWLGAWIS